MLELYYTLDPIGSDEFIRFILRRYYNIPNPSICKTINGKPYLDSGKIQFNLSHSKQMTALAVAKKQVGLDCESLTGKARPAVLNKFTAREKAEIQSTADFYAHWTARESFIKYLGATLSAYWRKVEYWQGQIYFSGERSNVPVMQFEIDGFIFSACGNFSKLTMRRVNFARE